MEICFFCSNRDVFEVVCVGNINQDDDICYSIMYICLRMYNGYAVSLLQFAIIKSVHLKLAGSWGKPFAFEEEMSAKSSGSRYKKQA